MRRALMILAVAVALLGWQLLQRTTDSTNGRPLNLDNTTEAGLQDWIRSDPQSAEAHARLGLLYLQQVRATGDPAYYVAAEEALNAAIGLDPQHTGAMIGQGVLAAARHDFPAALQWGEQAYALNPYSATALGVMVDAHVELGNYDSAVASVEQMVALRPDLQSFSRVSYVRELLGDSEGAIEAMAAAVDAGIPGTEEMLWSLVQLGDLHLRYGSAADAVRAYTQARQLQEDYVYAHDGQARAAMAAGDYETAIALYEPLVERFPMPQFAWMLGDAYAAIGNTAAAERNYALVRVIQQVNRSAGMNVDLEMVLFDAEHGEDSVATVAQARAVYAERRSIYAADALAWALFHNGDIAAAKQYSDEALRLGSADPALHARAEVIAAATP